MKRFLFLLLAGAMLVNPAFAAESAAVADIAVEAASEDTVNPLVPLGYDLLAYVLSAVALALGALIMNYVRKLAAKAGFEVDEKMLALGREKVAEAVHLTEQWARNKAKESKNKPTSSEKLKKALETVQKLAEGTGASKLGKEKLELLIEGYVERLTADRK